jgi:protein-S-isoprenylcysteine O-methyltransferase Ste14
LKNYQKWASTDHPASTRIKALIPAGLLFLFFIPYLLVVPLPRLDPVIHLPHLYYGMVNILLGVIMILSGGFFAIWSILSQFFLAEGTPLPMLPTRKLLVRGPFRLCRNPMTLGTILAYSGVAVLVGSLSSFLFVMVFFTALLCYLKFLEEKELTERFGQEYLDYKAATPFIIPRIAARKKT